MAEQIKPQPTAVKKFEEATVEQVLHRVNGLQEIGGLTLPPDYNAANALRSAWLILQESKDMAKQPVLQTCTKESIANTLFNMVTQGLNPVKRQCSFISYGNKLTLQREYAGSIALAKRHGDVKEIYAGVIYEGDTFEYEIDNITGRKKITKHLQSMENINDEKIRGAYGIAVFNDGTSNMEVMTMPQIRKSWAQGQSKGDGPAHKNFPGEMAKKSVINRLCKLLIATSDDSILSEPETDNRVERAKAQIEDEANTGELVDIPTIEAEAVQDAEIIPDPLPEPEPTPTPEPTIREKQPKMKF